jgi:hypothetical protein
MTWWSWRRETLTVGLPLCYLFSLATIHLVGAWVFTLPWNQLPNGNAVAVGFQECSIGVTAFLCGVLVFDFVHKGKMHQARFNAMRKSAVTTANEAVLRLPEMYVMLGVLFVAVLIPVLRRIPSIGAVANSGAYLIVGGCCLACRRHWQQKDYGRLFAWIAATMIFPLFTMVTMGFLGYGVFAALIVFTFVMCFYRPRWQSLVALAVLFYFGLSVFVTYMRDRNDFRQVVWGGQSVNQNLSARIHEVITMFSQFEWFDPHDDRQLEAIDGRLNQNSLVGAAVINLNNSAVSYANGRTIGNAILALIPRIIWPGKPVRAGSPEIVSHYTGIEFAAGTSVGVGQVMEFYINFGRWGIILGFFCIGMIVRWLDWRAARCLQRDDWRGFMTSFLPGMAFLQTGGSLIEVMGTFAASTVLVLVVNQFLWEYSIERKGRPPKHRGHPANSGQVNARDSNTIEIK